MLRDSRRYNAGGQFYWRSGRVREAAAGPRYGPNMHEEAMRGDADAIAARLATGEHPDQRDYIRAGPLAAAAGHGHAAAAAELLRGRAGAECADSGGRTPLHEAAARGRLQAGLCCRRKQKKKVLNRNPRSYTKSSVDPVLESVAAQFQCHPSNL